MTKDVEVLLGNPKKAILAMAIPTTIAMVAQSVTNLTDAMWVSGLGTDALAAVGIVFPLFFIMIGVGQGIGIGAAAAISRRIGADNKADADRTAAHAVVLMVLSSIIITIVVFIFLEPTLRFLGTGASEETIQQCLLFARPMVLFTIVFLAVGVMSNVIRSEGAAKRSMYVVIMVAVINLIIEPFFIYDYGLGWGMTGASLATVVAEAAGITLIFYWYFIKKDLFLKFKFKGFRFDRVISKDIFKVGIPAAFQLVVISVVSIFMLRILLIAGGDDGVAIYSSDWRIISILTIPVMGIAMGIVPVCAAALGAERYDKIRDAYNYALKISILLMLVVMVITIIFAPQMNMAFTYTADTEHLRGGMTDFLRIAALFLPFFAMGNCAESLFQSLGMGMKSLTSTIFRNFLMVPLCYAAAVLTSGLTFIWWGASLAEIISSAIIVLWSFYVLRGVIKRRSSGKMRDIEEAEA